MKNKSLSIFLATVILLSFATLTQAAKNSDSGSGGASGAGSETTYPSQPAVQVKNQVETKNQGEDSQLMIETKEETNTGAASDTSKKDSPRNEMAQEKMSEVSKQVEELLGNKTMKGGVGEQVREIATKQKMAQEQVKTQLDQVESRKGLLKSLLGPDYKALKSVESQVKANQLRIEELVNLQAELTDAEEIAMIEETILSLTEQNTQLQDTITSESQAKSMFGWLFKYFAK